MKQIPESIKQQAIALRQQGLSYAEISTKLNISVDWCKRNLNTVDKERKDQWLGLKSLVPVDGLNCVYLFAKHNDILYVGSSTCILQRLYKHRVGSKFYEDSTHIIVEVYSTYSEMVFNEAQLIAKHKPLNNKLGISGGVSNIEIPSLNKIIIQTTELA